MERFKREVLIMKRSYYTHPGYPLSLQFREYGHSRVTLMVLAEKLNVLIPKRHNTQTFLFLNFLIHRRSYS